MEINEKLKNGRIALNMSQEQAADAVGISRRTLVYYESGERTPNADILFKFCALYGLEAEDVIASSLKGKVEEAENSAKGNSLELLIREYLRHEEEKKEEAKRIIITTFAVISIVILFCLACLTGVKLYLSYKNGYEFGQATADLWTGLLNELIEVINNELVVRTPVVSIVIASVIILGWAIFFAVRFIIKKRSK